MRDHDMAMAGCPISSCVLWALSTFVMIYFPRKATVACADHEAYGVMMLQLQSFVTDARAVRMLQPSLSMVKNFLMMISVSTQHQQLLGAEQVQPRQQLSVPGWMPLSPDTTPTEDRPGRWPPTVTYRHSASHSVCARCCEQAVPYTQVVRYEHEQQLPILEGGSSIIIHTQVLIELVILGHPHHHTHHSDSAPGGMQAELC